MEERADAPSTSPPTAIDVEAEALFQDVAASLRAAGVRAPGATYRVQLGPELTFARLAEIVPYLQELGVTTVYASPFLKARRGSVHGYDVVDHNALHEAIGTREELDALTQRLAQSGMGLLLDFVPNHMGIGPENAWWLDLLENGAGSLAAPCFDVEWSPRSPELQGKVLLPVLGDHYGRVLEDGQITLGFDQGLFQLRHADQLLPVHPDTVPQLLGPLAAAVSERLGEESDVVLELQSILTGLSHLPPRAESRRFKVIERKREKEILRRRLATVVADHAVVAEELQRTLLRLNGTRDDPRSFDDLDRLIGAQGYRLSFWSVAAEEINYRRFFDNNDLAAIRMEHPPVFESAHRLLFELVRLRQVQGLRIDHPDGLWDPQGYLTQLQCGLFLELCEAHWLAQSGGEGAARREAFALLRPRLAELQRRAAADPRDPVARPLFVVVEKILTRGEMLPEAWPVHGTTGYDFADACAGLFVDGEADNAMTAIYQDFAGPHPDIDTLVYEKKKLILQTSLASELEMLGRALSRRASADRHSRDFTQGSLTAALREIIASFPVYRTYVTETTETLSENDRIAVARALRLALYRNPSAEASVYHFVGAMLLLDLPGADAARQLAWRQFVMKVQQLTSPVMAKGVEDTAFYVYCRLVSLNDVGGDPARFGTDVATFHRLAQQRQRVAPQSLLAGTTHDSKRSMDVRARISVLSEVPGLWQETLAALTELAQPHRVDVAGRIAPDRNEEYLLYQTLIGAWPAGLTAAPSAELAAFTDRIAAYMVKACREAKVNASWLDGRPAYVQAMDAFVRAVLAPGSPFVERLLPLCALAAWHGMWSSLAALVLRLTVPGVPDLYQGEELWSLQLVDPDNRRPTDFARRRELLAELQTQEPSAGQLLEHPEDGRIKLHVVRTLLGLRREHPDWLDGRATYTPVHAEGAKADHVVAFARRGGDAELLVAVPRLTAKLCAAQHKLPLAELWGDTALPVGGLRYRDVLTGAELQAQEGPNGTVLPLAVVLGGLPVAVLQRVGPAAGADAAA